MKTYRLRVKKFGTNKSLFDGVFIEKEDMVKMLHKIREFFNGWKVDGFTEDTLMFVYDENYPRQLHKPIVVEDEPYKDSN